MRIDQLKANVFPGESGGDYNALFGYSNRPGGQFSGVNLTDMTVDQALQFSSPSGPYGQWVKGQVGRVATPMGAYQVVGTTLRAAKDGLGLTGQEKMTSELQDRIGQWIYQTQGPGAWEAWGKGGSQMRSGQPTMASQGAGTYSPQPEERLPFKERLRAAAKSGQLFENAASAFNSLRMRPDPNLDATIANRRETRAGEAQKNRTMAALQRMAESGNPKAAQALQYAQASGDAIGALRMAFEPSAQPKGVVMGDRLVDPRTGQLIADFSGQGSELSAAEQKINRLVETGLDRNLAIGIADGRFRVSRNPDTQRAEVIDVATGQAVGQPVDDQTVETVRSVEPSAVFDDTNVPGALGASGFGASALNAITDAIGMGQAAPEIGRAQQELSNLSTRSMLALSAEFPGRPSNLTRERIEAMTIKPGELSTGPEAALNKAAAMRRMVQQAYDAASSAAAGEGGLSSQQRTQARASLSQLEPLLADYIALERALSSTPGSANIRPDVADRLDAYP